MNTKSNRTSKPDSFSQERKKLSSAAIVAAQHKAKSEPAATVRSIVRPRVENGLNPNNGSPTLIAIFPESEGAEPHKLDIGFLLKFPNLQPMFIDAILSWGRFCGEVTRAATMAALRTGFFEYLGSVWSFDLKPQELDDELLIGFKEYLLHRVDAEGNLWNPNHTRKLLGALRAVLDALEFGIWAKTARHIVERIPFGPTGANKKSEPTEVLDLEKLSLILAVAEREVLEVEERFFRLKELLIQGMNKLNDPNRVEIGNQKDYGDLDVCLAALDMAYPHVIPGIQEITAYNRSLGRAVQYIHRHQAVCSYFFPTARDLVPFVLLLAIATVFNPDTVLKLKWSNIDLESDRAGTPVVEIMGEKARATEDLPRLLDPEGAVSSQLSLKRLLHCLKNISSRIRPAASPKNKDFLFLCIQQRCKKEPTGLRSGGHGGSIIWWWALENFIKDNGLPPFTLSQLRPTILSLVQFADGSLEAAQRVGNHKSPTTTWTHYTSSAVKKRYRERIGEIIMLRERWVETKGDIDPRRLQTTQNKGAATPGFLCLDPLASPRPNQQRGKLCKDYGGCPGCPMAAPFPNDPVNVRYYSALEAAIYRSQMVMSTRTWFERWVPVLADLRALLELVPPNVIKESKKLSINLPNVG